MNLQEIQSAVASLSPKEFALISRWLKDYDNTTKSRNAGDSNLTTDDLLKKLQGSLRGSGAMQTFVDERRRGWAEY